MGSRAGPRGRRGEVAETWPEAEGKEHGEELADHAWPGEAQTGPREPARQEAGSKQHTLVTEGVLLQPEEHLCVSSPSPQVTLATVSEG